jgi:hypothetical protein
MFDIGGIVDHKCLHFLLIRYEKKFKTILDESLLIAILRSFVHVLSVNGYLTILY